MTSTTVSSTQSCSADPMKKGAGSALRVSQKSGAHLSCCSSEISVRCFSIVGGVVAVMKRDETINYVNKRKVLCFA